MKCIYAGASSQIEKLVLYKRGGIMPMDKSSGPSRSRKQKPNQKIRNANYWSASMAGRLKTAFVQNTLSAALLLSTAFSDLSAGISSSPASYIKSTQRENYCGPPFVTIPSAGLVGSGGRLVRSVNGKGYSSGSSSSLQHHCQHSHTESQEVYAKTYGSFHAT